MRLHQSALKTLVISLLVFVAALVLAFLGIGLKYNFGAEATVLYLPLVYAVLAVVVTSFLFGWVRYELNGGVALAVAVLHDQLLSFALTSLLSLVFPLSAYTPVFLVAGVAASYVFSVPVLRDARQTLRSNNSLKREQAAAEAVKSGKPLKFTVAVIAVLSLSALIISGNSAMLGTVLPLFTGLFAALVSSCFLTPYLWASMDPRISKRR
ncbi:MAG: hypothetical protein QM308_05620 [Bacillota bacterium]|nr:hypothetical protein [Bacillota bacterium]